VLHCGYDPLKSKSGKWRKLGGKFREIHPAIGTGKARGGEANVTLFGVADDGSVHARDARSEGQNWDRLGDQPVRAVAPVSATGAAASLLAVSDEGSLLHYARRNGRWRADDLNVRVSGESRTKLLTAVVIDQLDGKDSKKTRRELVIGAMSEDHRVRMLRWPDYPDGSPETRWKELGSVQELLAGGEEGAKPGGQRPARRAQKMRAE
jgi:hypothetical protein